MQLQNCWIKDPKPTSYHYCSSAEVCWQLVRQICNKGRKTCSLKKSWPDKSSEKRKKREGEWRQQVYLQLLQRRAELTDQLQLVGRVRSGAKRGREGGKNERDLLSFPRLSFKVLQMQRGGRKPHICPLRNTQPCMHLCEHTHADALRWWQTADTAWGHRHKHSGIVLLMLWNEQLWLGGAESGGVRRETLLWGSFVLFNDRQSHKQSFLC